MSWRGLLCSATPRLTWWCGVCLRHGMPCSPFDDATAALPRLRALPPAPAWLQRALHLDAHGCPADEAEDDAARQPLSAA